MAQGNGTSADNPLFSLALQGIAHPLAAHRGTSGEYRSAVLSYVSVWLSSFLSFSIFPAKHIGDHIGDHIGGPGTDAGGQGQGQGHIGGHIRPARMHITWAGDAGDRTHRGTGTGGHIGGPIPGNPGTGTGNESVPAIANQSPTINRKDALAGTSGTHSGEFSLRFSMCFQWLVK